MAKGESMQRKYPRKAPSQDPTSFYKGEDQGGARGSPSSVPAELKSGPMREKIMGRKNLGDFK